MNLKAALFGVVFLIAFAVPSRTVLAQEISLINWLDQVQDKEQQGGKLSTGKQPPDLTKPLLPDLTGQQPENPFDIFSSNANSESTAGFNPHMMGDFGGLYSRQVITVNSFQTITTTTSTTMYYSESETPVTTTTTTTKTVPVTQSRVVLVPVTSLGAFNVAENESPRPTDRVFGFYNFFGDIRGPDIGSNVPIVRNQTNTSTTTNELCTTTTTTQTQTVTPGVVPRVSLNREVFGFEKTFLDGFASVEVRMPLLQQQGGGFNQYDIGAVTIVGKYAFILDRFTGNVLSGGLAVTLPTGPIIGTIDGNVNTTLIQPWGGYIWNVGRFYFQGIHSLVVPTDNQIPILMFNDIGINYWLYRGAPNQFLTAVVPTFETHVTTPLTHRTDTDPLFVPDVLILTAGVHLGLFRNGLLSIGAAAPVTGPTLFSIEAFAQFNWYF